MDGLGHRQTPPVRTSFIIELIMWRGCACILTGCPMPPPPTDTRAPWDDCFSSFYSYTFPFKDLRPCIYLDLVLPRTVKLALTSAERQTKIAACEFLHSMVLYILGHAAPQAAAVMEKLYFHIFPAVLRLGCDVDSVSSQLFRPLLSQMIHWFTSNQSGVHKDASTLLDAIFDGLAHPTDTALRDFCAESAAEYLKWTIKQSTAKQLAKSPANVVSLIKRMYNMAADPQAQRRLGAAYAMNNMYRIFREYDTLVDQFLMELMVNFMYCLRYCHHDDPALGTTAQVTQTMKHFLRILDKKVSWCPPPLPLPVSTCIRISMLISHPTPSTSFTEDTWKLISRRGYSMYRHPC